MIPTKAFKNGVLLPVTVKTCAKLSGVLGVKNSSLFLSLRSVPENGKANKEATELLSAIFSLPQNRITLQMGTKIKNKVFYLEGLTIESAQLALCNALLLKH